MDRITLSTQTVLTWLIPVSGEIPESVRGAAYTAGLAVKTVAFYFGELEEYFKKAEIDEIHEAFWSQSLRPSLLSRDLGREMVYPDSLEVIGLCALLFRAVIEKAVALTYAILAPLGAEPILAQSGDEEPVDLVQQADKASATALARLQVVIEQMGIENREQ